MFLHHPSLLPRVAFLLNQLFRSHLIYFLHSSFCSLNCFVFTNFLSGECKLYWISELDSPTLLFTVIAMPVTWKVLYICSVAENISHLIDKWFFIHSFVDKHLGNFQQFVWMLHCADLLGYFCDYCYIIHFCFKNGILKWEGIYTYI